MNDKQKSLLNTSISAFDRIRVSMNNTNRGRNNPEFHIRGESGIRYKLSPSNKVTVSGINQNLDLLDEMIELLSIDDSEWQEVLGNDADIKEAKGKLITLINTAGKQAVDNHALESFEEIEGGEYFYKEPEKEEEEGEKGTKEPEEKSEEKEQEEGEKGIKEPEEKSEENNEPEPNKDEPKEKTVYRFGVKKSILEAEIAKYQKVIDQKGPVTNPNSSKVASRKRDIEEDLLGLYNKVANKEKALAELQEDKNAKNRTQEIADLKKAIQKDKKRIEDNLRKYGDVLDYGYIVKELRGLIDNSKFETFVELESIEKQIAFYENILNGAEINKDQLNANKETLNKEIEEAKNREKELKEEIGKASPSKELTLRDKASILKILKDFKTANEKQLKTNKGNHFKDLIGYLDTEIAKLEKEAGIQKEFAKLENESDRKLTSAEKNETLKILEQIKARISTSPSKNKSGGKNAFSDKALSKEIERIRKTKVEPNADVSKLQEELEKVQKEIEQKQKQVDDIDEKLKFHNQVPDHEKDLQKRSAEARLKELRKLEKDKELFKITEKGEIVINYPKRSLSKDEINNIQKRIINNAKSNIHKANDLMVKEFYGHKETRDEFNLIMDKLMDPENREIRKAKRIDEKGNEIEYEYEAIKEYEGRDEDLAKIQLSDYVKIFERVQKAEQGDLTEYENIKDGLTKQYEKDLEYLRTNNGKYDRVKTTTKNLKTLGKYGEKVEYSKFQQGEPVRNILRGAGNALKFVRNNVTAPVYHFVGEKIASPIYERTHRGQEGKSRGSFENKPLHRYLARREYYESEGKGFFSSRFNAIFNATKGNQALLNAGANEIEQFYKDNARKMIIQEIQEQENIRRLEAIEFRRKDIDDQISMLEEAVKTSTTPEDKAKYEQTLSEYKRAAKQIAKDKEVAMNKGKTKEFISMDSRYDTIDMDQHDKANKDTITKSVAVIKGVSKLGIRKFVAPKIKEWLVDKSKIEIEKEVETGEFVKEKKYVQTTYKDSKVPVYDTRANKDISMSEIMSKNAGKEVEGYYSVYGGEVRPQTYTLTGNEKITAVFQSEANRGVGFSDTAGLTAPTLTDKTFDSSIIDSVGVLNQDTTIQKFIDMIGSGKVDESTLDGLYVSIGDKYWARLSDLQGTLEEVKVGETVEKVVDQLGHWEEVDTKIPITEIVKTTVENPRISRIVKALGLTGKGLYGASVVEDVYENTRETKTDEQHTKPEKRDINPKDKGYTGKRREDLDDEER